MLQQESSNEDVISFDDSADDHSDDKNYSYVQIADILRGVNQEPVVQEDVTPPMPSAPKLKPQTVLNR